MNTQNERTWDAFGDKNRDRKKFTAYLQTTLFQIISFQVAFFCYQNQKQTKNFLLCSLLFSACFPQHNRSYFYNLYNVFQPGVFLSSSKATSGGPSSIVIQEQMDLRNLTVVVLIVFLVLCGSAQCLTVYKHGKH